MVVYRGTHLTIQPAVTVIVMLWSSIDIDVDSIVNVVIDSIVNILCLSWGKACKVQKSINEKAAVL